VWNKSLVCYVPSVGILIMVGMLGAIIGLVWWLVLRFDPEAHRTVQSADATGETSPGEDGYR
jgi:hypothetical protein